MVKLNTPRTYANAKQALGNRASKKIGHNTYLVPMFGCDAIAVCYHHTNVVTFTADGIVQLRSGGWQTNTTQARLNSWLHQHGFNLYSVRGEWKIFEMGNPLPFDFEEGFNFKVLSQTAIIGP